MKHLLLATLLLLTLFTGCKKEENTPQPTAKPQLEGFWEATTFNSVEKTPAGKVVSDTTITITVPTGSDIVTITATEFFFGPNTTNGLGRAYTRKDDVLTFFTNDFTIQELTDTKLVLVNVSDVAYPPNILTNTTTYRRK